MANNELKLKITVDGKDAEISLNGFASSFKNVNSGVESAQNKLKDFVFTVNETIRGLENVARYAKSAFDFLKEGVNYTETAQSFSAYAKSLGKDSDKIIESLRKASAGTISNKNLILTASKAMALGVTTDSEQMGKLLEVARSRARVFGIETTQAFDDIVTGIGRASPQILDNLGIRIPDGFDKMTQGMSAAQKVSKLLELTLEAGGKEIEAIGGITLTGADKFRQLEVAVEDLNAKFKAELAENLMPLVDFAKNTGIPAMKTGLDFINDSIKAIKSLDEQFDAVNVTLSTTAGALGALALSKALTNITLITDAIKKANTAQKAFNITALANPWIAVAAGLAVTGYASKIKYDEWQAGNLEKANMQSLYESENPASISRAKIYKLEQELSQFNSLDALEKQKSDLENNLLKAQSALKGAKSGYALGAFQNEINTYKTEIADLSVKIEKIEAIKKALYDEKDTLEVINKQQKALVETGEANIETATKIAAIDDNRVKIADKLIKSYANLDAQFKPLLANESEAYNLLENMTYAAGGLGVNLKNGTTEAGKLADKLSKVDNSIIKALSDKEYTSADFATGAMDFMTGGLFTAKGSNKKQAAKDAYSGIKIQLAEDLSNAVAAGIINSDIVSAINSFGSALGNALSQSFTSKNPIIGTNGGFNFTNFVGSFAISAGVSALSKTLGKAFDNNKKSVMQRVSNTTNAVNDAFLNSYTYAYNPYVSDYDWSNLADRRNNQNGIYVGYKKKAFHAYHTDISSEAYNYVAELEAMMKNADNRAQSDKWHLEELASTGRSFQALTIEVQKYSDTLGRVSGMNTTAISRWTDASMNASIDLSETLHKLKVDFAELTSALGTAKAELNSVSANSFLVNYAYLDSLSAEKKSIFSSMFSANKSKQFDVALSSIDTVDSYELFRALSDAYQTEQATAFTWADKGMLSLIKQVGDSQFTLQSLQYTDPDAYSEKYLGILEKQVNAAQAVMSYQEAIFKDAAKTIEEQQAALEEYQSAQNTYYQTKLEVLAQEQAQQEAIAKKELEAKARSRTNLESALSIVGELGQRSQEGNKIVVIQAGNVTQALKDLISSYADDPEMLAMLKNTLTIAEQQGRWG